LAGPAIGDWESLKADFEQIRQPELLLRVAETLTKEVASWYRITQVLYKRVAAAQYTEKTWAARFSAKSQETSKLKHELEVANHKKDKVHGELSQVKAELAQAQARAERATEAGARVTDRPRPFRGDPLDVEAWIGRMEDHFMLVGMAAHQKSLASLNFMDSTRSHSHRTWIHTTCLHKRVDYVPWSEFVEHVRQQHRNAADLDDLRARLRPDVYKQKDKESTPDYAARLNTDLECLRLALGKPLPDDEQVAIFAKGLRNNTLRLLAQFQDRPGGTKYATLRESASAVMDAVAADPKVYNEPRHREGGTDSQPPPQMPGKPKNGNQGRQHQQSRGKGTGTNNNNNNQQQQPQQQKRRHGGQQDPTPKKPKLFCSICHFHNHLAADCRNKGLPAEELNALRRRNDDFERRRQDRAQAWKEQRKSTPSQQQKGGQGGGIHGPTAGRGGDKGGKGQPGGKKDRQGKKKALETLCCPQDCVL